MNNTLGRKLSETVWEFYGGRTTRQSVKEALVKLGVDASLVNKLTQKLTTYSGACWLGAATDRHYDDQKLVQVLGSHCLNCPPSRWEALD